MPEPLANWNPTRGVWETTELCLYGRSEPYSDPWPTSGTTRAGKAYARPTWALLTNDSESSSSPGLLGTPRTSSANGVGQYEESERGDRGRLEAQVDALLKTPGANLATNGGSQHPDKRKEGGHGPTLADEVEWLLLPTPMTMNGKSGRTMETSTGGGQKNRGGHSGPPGLDEVVSLATGTRPAHLPPDEKLPPRTRQIVEAMLPTPTAIDGQGGPKRLRADGRTEADHGSQLRDVAPTLLPTPLARDHRTGYQQERTDRVGSPPLNDAVVTIARPPAKPSGDRTEEPSDDGKLF